MAAEPAPADPIAGAPKTVSPRVLAAAVGVLPILPMLAFSEGWHGSMQFLSRGDWWLVALAMLAANLAVFNWSIQRPARLVFAVAYGFVITLFGAGAGSAGCRGCYFDWVHADSMRFLNSGVGLTWFSVATNDGLVAAGLTALALLIVLWPYARALRRAGGIADNGWAGPLGRALLVLSTFAVFQMNIEPPLFQETMPPPAEGRMVWTVSFTLGLVLCALALAPAFTNGDKAPRNG